MRVVPLDGDSSQEHSLKAMLQTLRSQTFPLVGNLRAWHAFVERLETLPGGGWRGILAACLGRCADGASGAMRIDTGFVRMVCG